MHQNSPNRWICGFLKHFQVKYKPFNSKDAFLLLTLGLGTFEASEQSSRAAASSQGERDMCSHPIGHGVEMYMLHLFLVGNLYNFTF